MRRGQGVLDEYLILNGLSHAAVVSKSSTVLSLASAANLVLDFEIGKRQLCLKKTNFPSA